MPFLKPVEAGQGQQGGVGDAIEQFLQPRMHIAAKGHDAQIGPKAQGLCRAANGRGAEAGALGQIVDALHRYRDEGIAHILAFEEGGHADAGRQASGNILG
ncbi:hypothetical protein D3C87_1509390 [compost metagenome]